MIPWMLGEITQSKTKQILYDLMHGVPAAEQRSRSQHWQGGLEKVGDQVLVKAQQLPVVRWAEGGGIC